MRKEIILGALPSLCLAAALIYQSFAISRVEENTAEQIGNFMAQITPLINFPDTSKRVVAPPLKSIGDFFLMEGTTKWHSKKLLDAYEYFPEIPLEIWEGYITRVESNSGGQYYVWSTNKLEPIGAKVNGWFFVSTNTWEYGYASNPKDKTYAQMLFPIVKSYPKTKPL